MSYLILLFFLVKILYAKQCLYLPYFTGSTGLYQCCLYLYFRFTFNFYVEKSYPASLLPVYLRMSYFKPNNLSHDIIKFITAYPWGSLKLAPNMGQLVVLWMGLCKTSTGKMFVAADANCWLDHRQRTLLNTFIQKDRFDNSLWQLEKPLS